MIRIVIALDGSPAVEAAIPHAAAVARSFTGHIELIRVICDSPAAVGPVDCIDWQLQNKTGRGVSFRRRRVPAAPGTRGDVPGARRRCGTRDMPARFQLRRTPARHDTLWHRQRQPLWRRRHRAQDPFCVTCVRSAGRPDARLRRASRIRARHGCSGWFPPLRMGGGICSDVGEGERWFAAPFANCPGPAASAGRCFPRIFEASRASCTASSPMGLPPMSTAALPSPAGADGAGTPGRRRGCTACSSRNCSASSGAASAFI